MKLLPHLVFGLLLSAAGSASTSAQAAPGSHFVSLNLGPSIGISDFAKTQFDLTQSYEYHVLGGPDALFVGVELQEGMGNYFRFAAGAHAGWDWQPMPKLPLYVSPELRMGLTTVDGEALFNLRFGVRAKYEITNGIFAMLRPVGVNLGLGEFSVSSFDILAGLGYGF